MTKRRRGRARGAAMVEAIVVMCVMLVFLGMNVWAFQAYGGKIGIDATAKGPDLGAVTARIRRRLVLSRLVLSRLTHGHTGTPWGRIAPCH